MSPVLTPGGVPAVKHPMVPCSRCGVLRQVHGGRESSLCRDCRFVMSADEVQDWERAA
jgi:hypothetical protein